MCGLVTEMCCRNASDLSTEDYNPSFGRGAELSTALSLTTSIFAGLELSRQELSRGAGLRLH